MVKRVLFFSMALLWCLFSSVSLYAQKVKAGDVPSEVIQSLNFEHPAAKVSSWVLEEEEYVAVFKEDGASGKAYFKLEGDWIKTTFSIPKNQIPPLIKDYVIANYPGFTYSIIQLRYVANERLHYYIEIKPDYVGKNSELSFSEKGELIERIDPPGFRSNVKESEKRAPEPKKTKPTQTMQSQKTNKSQPVKETEKFEEEEEKYYEEKHHETVNQQISAGKISEPIKKELAKKIPRPENVTWFAIDTFFVAKCIYKEQKNEVFITQNGKWEKTYRGLTEAAVAGNILKHLNSFHSGWRFKTAVGVVRADRKDLTLIDIYEKANWKQKLVTSILFDKMGKMIKTFEPEYDPDAGQKNKRTDAGLEKYYQKMSMESIKEQEIEIPEVVINAFKARYPKIANPQWSEEGDGYYASYMGARGKEIVVVGESGTLLQTQTAGKPEQASEAIKSYVKKNHKGFKIEELYSVRSLQDKQNLFRIIIANKKTGNKQDLWFTSSGKIIEYY